ncbi:MAG TPA: sulfatase-like hydrolase/transferase [Burkholderiaceae bacterium]|nr:sulfatase-like hydrolase/transferase [Burkholderiaceae bacterium]
MPDTPLPRRRQFLAGLGALGAATVAGELADRSQRPPTVPKLAGAVSAQTRRERRPNILLIVSDQERSGADLPAGLQLRAHEWLQERGTSFTEYHANTTPCSPSRSTMYFGQHTQHTRMTANIEAPPTFPQLPDGLPSVGHLLQAQGYYTAYKGKWHLSPLRHDPGLTYGPYPSVADALEPYGFSDFNADGDPHGATWTGFRTDRQTASNAIEWLGTKGRAMQGRQPWFLAVNFVNPHDVMYFSTGAQQEQTRIRRNVLAPLAGAPHSSPYQRAWDVPLPASFYADDLASKPSAQRQFVELCNALYGRIERHDEAAWHAYQSYYFNCIRDVDQQALSVLRALEEFGLDEDTIVIYTADHGEMAGAHGLRQKGPHIYKENVRLPFLVRHPDAARGSSTPALACCLDLTPTLLGFAGVQPRAREEAYPYLKGVDLSAAVASPAARTERDRRGILFNYGVPLYIDARYTESSIRTDHVIDRLTPLRVLLHGERPLPSLDQHALFRGIHDGRYKFARYFKPSAHHKPRDWDTLLAHNELELYDTRRDPDELDNLAAQPEQHKDLLLSLAARTNALVDLEVGADDGSEFPGPRALYNL